MLFLNHNRCFLRQPIEMNVCQWVFTGRTKRLKSFVEYLFQCDITWLVCKIEPLYSLIKFRNTILWIFQHLVQGRILFNSNGVFTPTAVHPWKGTIIRKINKSIRNWNQVILSTLFECHLCVCATKSHCTGWILLSNLLYMFTCLRRNISFRESKIDNVQRISLFTHSYEIVVRFDVTMYIFHSMQLLNSGNHLIPNP